IILCVVATANYQKPRSFQYLKKTGLSFFVLTTPLIENQIVSILMQTLFINQLICLAGQIKI
ncbi:MAG TPA: hypothetical protein VIM65_08640, partial [Cyclobacteriaceae bacterium]